MYFITSGSVSKMVALTKKFGVDLPPMSFFGMFEFFTGVNEQSPNIFYQTNSFTITQTIEH